MPHLRESLGLQQLPHFTTVQKAFQQLSTAIWCVLQRIRATLGKDGVAALDASGWVPAVTTPSGSSWRTKK